MSATSSEEMDADVEEIINRVEDSLESVRAGLTDEDDETLLEHAQDLWDALDELEDVLDTMDVGEAVDAVDLAELPETIEVGDIGDEDEAVLDLSNVMDAVNLRELWDAVDLSEFAGEITDLDDALEAVTGEGDMDELVDLPRIEADPATRQAYVESVVREAAEAFRKTLLVSHKEFRKLYEENQERFGTPGRQPDSRNPSAFSTMPPGPVPDSASTRTSTVPRRVRHSSSSYHPDRIYGRRFERAIEDEEAEADGNGPDTSDESAETPESSKADEEPDEDTPSEDASESDQDAGNEDGAPRITRHEADD